MQACQYGDKMQVDVKKKHKYPSGRVRVLRPTSVEKMGLQAEVFKLKKEGYSVTLIAKSLSDRHNIQLSDEQVRGFLKKNLEKLHRYLQDDSHAREDAKKRYNETINWLDEIKDDIEEARKQLKEEGVISKARIKVWETCVKMIHEYLAHFKPIAEAAGATIQQKINILNLTQNIDQSIKYFQKQGLVVISKDEYNKLLKAYERGDKDVRKESTEKDDTEETEAQA